jgi:hypothetical protein
MSGVWDQFPMRDAIAFQLVRYDHSWFFPMRLQQPFEEPVPPKNSIALNSLTFTAAGLSIAGIKISAINEFIRDTKA